MTPATIRAAVTRLRTEERAEETRHRAAMLRIERERRRLQARCGHSWRRLRTGELTCEVCDLVRRRG